MKLAYVTVYDAKNITEWSGLGYHIAQCLQNRGIHIFYIGSLDRRFDVKIIKAAIKIYHYIKFGKSLSFLSARNYILLKYYSYLIKKKLPNDIDIIFSPGTLPLTFLKSNLPKVSYTDATFHSISDFYFKSSDISSSVKLECDGVEKAALENMTLAIFSSDWASSSAIDYYAISKEKVHTIPFGANFNFEYNFDFIKQSISNRALDICNILFVGVEWERKGGPFALQVVACMNKMGLNTKLHIVGLQDSKSGTMPSFVINHGFISKADEKGRNELSKLFLSSHLLLVPSTAEAFGLVYCEANSFGLPAIATNVGGIPTIITDDVNGKMFSLNTKPEVVAKFLVELFNNQNQYHEMCFNAYWMYVEKLNWKKTGEAIHSLLESLVNKNK